MSEEKKPTIKTNIAQDKPQQPQQNPILTLATMFNNLKTTVSEQGVDIKTNTANMDLFDKRANFLAERIDYLEHRIERLERDEFTR